MPEPQDVGRATVQTSRFLFILTQRLQDGLDGIVYAMSNTILDLPQSTLPDEGLRTFHRISIWREEARTKKIKVKSWCNATRNLDNLTFIKNGTVRTLNAPKTIPHNTLYLPKSYNGTNVLYQLRNAFCHNGLSYDSKTGQYSIRTNNYIKIAGSFTINALADLINALLSTTSNSENREANNHKNK